MYFVKSMWILEIYHFSTKVQITIILLETNGIKIQNASVARLYDVSDVRFLYELNDNGLSWKEKLVMFFYLFDKFQS